MCSKEKVKPSGEEEDKKKKKIDKALILWFCTEQTWQSGPLQEKPAYFHFFYLALWLCAQVYAVSKFCQGIALPDDT